MTFPGPGTLFVLALHFAHFAVAASKISRPPEATRKPQGLIRKESVLRILLHIMENLGVPM